MAVDPIDLRLIRLLKAALQAIFQKMRAAFVEEHAALLVDEGLQELQLSIGELDLGS